MVAPRLRRICLLTILVTLALHSVAAHATTRTVRLDGTGDFTTIQAAINASVNGDVVLVADGTYGGSGNKDLDFGGRLITVRSEYGPVNCIIDASFARGFWFHSGETNAAILQGFTIEGGSPASGIGGGILCDGAWPTIVDMVIDNCYASNDGGGIAVMNIASNAAVYNSLILDNQAGDEGGGVFVESGRLTMRNCTIDNNDAFRGAGLYFTTYTPGVEVWDNIFWRNWASEPASITHQVGGSFGGNFKYNLVEGATGLPATNFDGNPVFVTGPLGSHYLSSNSSDAVDAGSGLASATCITTADGIRCMSELTTRTDQALDSGLLDVGYHYGQGPMDLLVPSAFGTIQAAIDAARPGDTVIIAAGTYTGTGNRDLDTLGKAITITSESGNPATCIIDCQASDLDPHRGFNIANGEGVDTVITGITIRNAFNNNGAGMRIAGTNPLIVNCVFEDIGGNDGGGMLVQSGANPTIRQCVFRNCSVGDAGGAICVSYAAATIHDCLFENNYARWGGGAVYFLDSIGNVSDSVFTGNVCDAWGGAMHVTRAGNYVLMERCTLDGNSAPQGAHVYTRINASIDVENCILTNSVAGSAVYSSDGGSAWVTCSDVWNNIGGDWVDGIAGQAGNFGNFSADPLFCNAVSGDFALYDNSPCTEANNTPGCGQVGALGIGCTSGPQTHTVLPDSSGDFATIQEAIDASSDGDTILLGAGTFTGTGNRDLNYGGRAITIRGQSTGSPSIIDCEGSAGDEHRGFWFGTGEGTDSILEHVQVTNGYAWDGGALHVTAGASPTIRDCRFEESRSTDDGGGVFLSHGSNITLIRCIIYNNSADNRGAGIYAHASRVTLDDCLVSNNNAVNNGGGIYTHEGGSVDLTDCELTANNATNGGGVYIQGPAASNILRTRFIQNVAVGSGGGFYERENSITSFDECVFQWNRADLGGGVYNVFQCEPVFTGCTFTENTATTRGGAIRMYTGADVTIANSILWGNHCGLGPQIASSSSSTLTVDCSDVQGGQASVDDYLSTTVFNWNANNIDLFPYFCDPNGGSLLLVDGMSPCLPAGNSCGVQMGAHGSGCSPPTDAGDGQAPVSVTRLGSARPNPFNPRTEIHFSLGSEGRARLAVFDARGRLVRVLVDEMLPSGPRTAPWDGRDAEGRVVGTGVYFYRLEFEGTYRTGKMTLLK